MEWLLLLGGGVVLVYGGAPLLIYNTMRAPAYPEIQIFEHIPRPEDTPPVIHDALEFIGREVGAVRDQGFQSEAYAVMPQAQPGLMNYLVMLTRRQTGDKAMVTAMITTNTPSPTVNTYVEYSTRFQSGKSVDTLNTSQLLTFLLQSGETKVQMPNVQDAGELYRIHRYAIARIAKIDPTDAPIVYPEDGAASYLRDMLRIEYESQVQRGQFRREGEGEQLVYRPTLRGAYRMTWRLLWPYSLILKQQMKSQAEKIVRESHAADWEREQR